MRQGLLIMVQYIKTGCKVLLGESGGIGFMYGKVKKNTCLGKKVLVLVIRFQ